jgi:4-carboxymuconolactone decarboxylase
MAEISAHLRPRVAPATEDAVDPSLRPLLASLATGGSLFPGVMANNAAIFPLWAELVRTLLAQSTLPPRERELLILRSAHLCGASHPWSRHVAIGKRVGITDEDLDRLRADGLTGWPYSDAVLIKAVDEIHTEFRISDETWLQLRDRYDVAQLVEVPFVIGFYHLNAVLANSLNVGVLDAPSED